jgi:hypothetical protein
MVASMKSLGGLTEPALHRQPIGVSFVGLGCRYLRDAVNGERAEAIAPSLG